MKSKKRAADKVPAETLKRILKMKFVACGGSLFADYDLMLERGRFVLVVRSEDQPICFRPMTAKAAAQWVLREIVPTELQSSFKIVA